jgi:hypothetical protein
MVIRGCLAGKASPKGDVLSAIQTMSTDYSTNKTKATLFMMMMMMMMVIIFTEECPLSVIFMRHLK